MYDDYHNKLIKYINSLTSKTHNLVIVDDFNLPDVCWSTLSGSSAISNKFCDFVFDSNLAQMICCRTHVGGNTRSCVH